MAPQSPERLPCCSPGSQANLLASASMRDGPSLPTKTYCASDIKVSLCVQQGECIISGFPIICATKQSLPSHLISSWVTREFLPRSNNIAINTSAYLALALLWAASLSCLCFNNTQLD